MTGRHRNTDIDDGDLKHLRRNASTEQNLKDQSTKPTQRIPTANWHKEHEALRSNRFPRWINEIRTKDADWCGLKI